jgi:protein phosphatase
MTVGVTCTIGAGPEAGGRDRNEDNFLVCQDGAVRWREGEVEVVHDAPATTVLLAVADGMGGHEDGARASTAAVRALSRLVHSHPDPSPELVLHRFFLATHHHLREELSSDGRVNTGTTLTCAWIVGDRLAWIHVGDSRLYLLRDGVLERFTCDHTRGLFAHRDLRPVPTDPEQLAQNFIFGSRGLGDNAAIRIDPGLDSGVLDLEPGDRLVACTDGVWGYLDDEGIADVLATAPEPADGARMLTERALANGSDDNLTALVARVDQLDGVLEPGGPLRLKAADTFVPW